MNKTIDIKAALQFGYDRFRENFVFFLKVLIIGIVIVVIPTMIISKITAAVGIYLGLPLQFLNMVWQSIVAMGILKICLKICDGQAVEIPDLWSCAPLTVDYILAKIIYGVIVVVGFILLIIPRFIWSIQFYLANYLVVDRKASAMAAIKGSSLVTRGAKWDLGVFASVVLVINIIGLVFFGVGLLITLPITMLASVYVYRELLKQTETAGLTIQVK